MGEEHGRVEHVALEDRLALDNPLVEEVRQDGGDAVVAQAARVDARRLEHVAERIHRHQWREMAEVAEVVGVFAARQRRAGHGLDGDGAHLAALAQAVHEEGVGQAGDVGAAAAAADDDVGILVDLLHLLFGFEADDRLVQEHVVEHAAQSVARRLGVGQRVLDRLTDGATQAAERIGMRGEHFASCLGGVAGAGHDLSAVGLHENAAIGLLLVADLDHVDGAVEPGHFAGDGESRPPLSAACFGGDAPDPGRLVEVDLRHGRVELVAARGVVALELVIDARWRPDGLFQVVGAVQRRGAEGTSTTGPIT